MTTIDIDRNLQQKLSKALTELPTAYSQLHLFTLPGSRAHDEHQSRRGTLSTRAPLILEVLDLLDRRQKDAEPTREHYDIDRLAGARRCGILPTLTQWVLKVDGQLWDEAHDHEPPTDAPTVDGECRWLRSHAGWIAERDWATEITDDLTRMLKDCTLITGTSTELIKLTCTNAGCGWPVREEDGGAWYHCTGCGRSWGRLELHRMAERKKPRSLAFLAEFAGLHPRTVLRYIKAHNIKPVAREGTLNLYDLTAVMEATSPERYKSA